MKVDATAGDGPKLQCLMTFGGDDDDGRRRLQCTAINGARLPKRSASSSSARAPADPIQPTTTATTTATERDGACSIMHHGHHHHQSQEWPARHFARIGPGNSVFRRRASESAAQTTARENSRKGRLIEGRIRFPARTAVGGRRIEREAERKGDREGIETERRGEKRMMAR